MAYSSYGFAGEPLPPDKGKEPQSSQGAPTSHGEIEFSSNQGFLSGDLRESPIAILVEGSYLLSVYMDTKNRKGTMTPIHTLRIIVSESQAQELRRRIAALPFKVKYQEQQRGADLVALVGCTPSQEKPLQDIVHDLGATQEDIDE